eukprot:Selendium_serpulae@DN5662_c0_g1_i1.p1
MQKPNKLTNELANKTELAVPHVPPETRRRSERIAKAISARQSGDEHVAASPRVSEERSESIDTGRCKTTWQKTDERWNEVLKHKLKSGQCEWREVNYEHRHWERYTILARERQNILQALRELKHCCSKTFSDACFQYHTLEVQKAQSVSDLRPQSQAFEECTLSDGDLCLFAQPGEVLLRLIERLDLQFEFALDKWNKPYQRMARDHQTFLQLKLCRQEMFQKNIFDLWNKSLGTDVATSRPLLVTVQCLPSEQDIIGAALRAFPSRQQPSQSVCGPAHDCSAAISGSSDSVEKEKLRRELEHMFLQSQSANTKMVARLASPFDARHADGGSGTSFLRFPTPAEKDKLPHEQFQTTNAKPSILLEPLRRPVRPCTTQNIEQWANIRPFDFSWHPTTITPSSWSAVRAPTAHGPFLPTTQHGQGFALAGTSTCQRGGVCSSESRR